MTPFPRMPDSTMSALDIVVRPTATAALSAHITFVNDNKMSHKEKDLFTLCYIHRQVSKSDAQLFHMDHLHL